MRTQLLNRYISIQTPQQISLFKRPQRWRNIVISQSHVQRQTLMALNGFFLNGAKPKYWTCRIKFLLLRINSISLLSDIYRHRQRLCFWLLANVADMITTPKTTTFPSHIAHFVQMQYNPTPIGHHRTPGHKAKPLSPIAFEEITECFLLHWIPCVHMRATVCFGKEDELVRIKFILELESKYVNERVSIQWAVNLKITVTEFTSVCGTVQFVGLEYI